MGRCETDERRRDSEEAENNSAVADQIGSEGERAEIGEESADQLAYDVEHMGLDADEIGIGDGTFCPWDPEGEFGVNEALESVNFSDGSGADLGALTDVAGCGGCGGCGSPAQGTGPSALFGDSFLGSDAPGDIGVDSGGDSGGGFLGAFGAYAAAVGGGDHGDGGGGGDGGGDGGGCGGCGGCGG